MLGGDVLSELSLEVGHALLGYHVHLGEVAVGVHDVLAVGHDALDRLEDGPAHDGLVLRGLDHEAWADEGGVVHGVHRVIGVAVGGDGPVLVEDDALRSDEVGADRDGVGLLVGLVALVFLHGDIVWKSQGVAVVVLVHHAAVVPLRVGEAELGARDRLAVFGLVAPLGVAVLAVALVHEDRVGFPLLGEGVPDHGLGRDGDGADHLVALEGGDGLEVLRAGAQGEAHARDRAEVVLHVGGRARDDLGVGVGEAVGADRVPGGHEESAAGRELGDAQDLLALEFARGVGLDVGRKGADPVEAVADAVGHAPVEAVLAREEVGGRVDNEYADRFLEAHLGGLGALRVVVLGVLHAAVIGGGGEGVELAVRVVPLAGVAAAGHLGEPGPVELRDV